MVPLNQRKLLNLLINESKTCPAIMLASRRKQRVIGRTSKLTSSINLKKGANSPGELEGRKDENGPFLFIKRRSLLLQVRRAKLRLKLSVVETGKEKTDRESRLTNLKVRKIERKYLLSEEFLKISRFAGIFIKSNKRTPTKKILNTTSTVTE